MRIGIGTAHGYGIGGGWSAVWWHVKALLDLDHNVTVFTHNQPHPVILKNWIDGRVGLAWYTGGVEAGFDCWININHFGWSQPIAKLNLAHLFFPMADVSPPPDNVRLYANSRYTASHVRYKWGRDAEVMYIPIKSIYKPLPKEPIILHVSRISEPSVWADKGHRQMIEVFKMYNKELPGWRLFFCGSIDPRQETYFGELMQTARGFPIEFKLEMTDTDLAEMYGRAAIYWHCTGVSIPTVPSAQEHWGIAPLEAQAAGCVPIVFNSGGMPEVVLPGVTGGLFDDIREMGRMTVNLTRDWSMWSALSQQGVEWAKNWQNYPAFKTRIACMLAGEPIPEMPDLRPQPKYSAKDVTAVIPTWNNEPMLARCLESLARTAPDMKVLVINNGDPLMSIPTSESVRVYDAGTNLGFAGAHKLAESMVDTPLVLMLNDDVEAITGNWLHFLLMEMNDPKIGVVGPKLVFGDGNLQHAGGAIDWRREDFGFHRWYGQPDMLMANAIEDVPYVTGAALLCRRELYHMEPSLESGLFCEDMWLCFQAKEQGFRTRYQPASVLLHHEAMSRKRAPESEDKISRNRRIFKERWL